MMEGSGLNSFFQLFNKIGKKEYSNQLNTPETFEKKLNLL